MSNIKIKFRKNAKALENYIFEHRELDDPVSFNNCTENFVSEMFLATQKFHGKEDVNQAIHIIQSWGPEESQSVDPLRLNKLGHQLVSRYFPGHDFAVVTHTDTGKTHNHIMVNPVHSECGKRVKNKFEHFHKLKDINDELARENGLSIIKQHSREKWDKKSDKVKGIESRIGFSKVKDLKEKLKFSMSVATSFDEYSAYLDGAFGIKLKIKGQTVSYLYPGNSRFRRARGLGAKYDFDSLVKSFKANDESLISFGVKDPKSIEDKNYREYHKFSKDEKEFRVQENKLKDLIIPEKTLEELKKSSIEKFCEKNSIPLVSEQDGYKRLSGREYIRIKENIWENEKNNTRGGLIEFASNLNREDYLNTIHRLSEIKDFSKMKRALEIPEPSFRSFYVPNRSKSKKDRKILNALAAQEKMSRTLLYELSRLGQLKAYEKERFKLYPSIDRSKSITYYKSPKGNWFTRRSQGLKSDFINISGKKNELYIFASPIDFLKSKSSERLLKMQAAPISVTVPLEPLEKWLSQRSDFLSSFKKVRLIWFEDRGSQDQQKNKNKTETKELVIQNRWSVQEFDEYLKKEFLSKERNLDR